jgi:glycosyltransferase involved in cell wall biosynthesis
MLQIADIFALPSQTREGLGLAVIEAMATGLPVIGTDVGGIPELIRDGENGLLVPSGNPEKLADAIRKLSDDQILRSSMGERGRQIYENKFTLTKMIQQIEHLYDELLQQKIHGVRL